MDTARGSADSSLDFRQVFDAAPTPSLLLGIDLIVIDVNAAYLGLTLTRREDILGRPVLSVFPDIPVELRASVERVRRTRAADALALQVCGTPQAGRASGTEPRYLSRVNSPVFDKSGQIACILHAVQDVTSGVDLQPDPAALLQLPREIAARQRVESQLRGSERRIAAVVASAMDAILTIDALHRVVEFNAAAEIMFGVPASAAVGSPLNRFLPERYRNIHSKHVSQFIERGATSRRMGKLQELRGLRADGTEFPLEASISKVFVGERVLSTVIVRDISERRDLEEGLRLASLHDPLTKLPSRDLLVAHAERSLSSARRAGKHVVLLFIDMDRFKPINDTYGHGVGDEVLQEVARRLAANVREEDSVGRLGSDEFIVVLSNVHAEDDAVRVAALLLRVLGEPYITAGHALLITPSIGISVFPHDGSSAGELVRHADAAMGHAKQAGGNVFRFYRHEHNAHAEAALQIESRIPKGLEAGEFEVHYQPILDLKSRRVVAAEALARWPAMNVGPEDFIPMAETAGFMPTLGAWILHEACKQRRAWRDAQMPSFPVTVNISPTQFRLPDFAQTVWHAVSAAGLGPGDLKVEVTENLAMQRVDDAVKVLGDLRQMGVKVALDNFGTGYSSLANLTRLPLDILKLDPSFVQNIGRDANCTTVVHSILALAHSLGLVAVAEGIESEEALAFLLAHGCQQGQGRLFSAPLSGGQFQVWCRQMP